MPQICDKCGKFPSTGFNVSHSQRHTKRRFLPNLHKKKIFDTKTSKTKVIKICTSCYRSLTKIRRKK